MLKEFTEWLLKLIEKLFTAVWDFISDLFVSIISTVFDAVVSVISSIPIPGWLGTGLAGPFGNMDSAVIYVVTGCGVPQALAIIGAGYLFRISRKLATAFQW